GETSSSAGEADGIASETCSAETCRAAVTRAGSESSNCTRAAGHSQAAHRHADESAVYATHGTGTTSAAPARDAHAAARCSGTQARVGSGACATVSPGRDGCN